MIFNKYAILIIAATIFLTVNSVDVNVPLTNNDASATLNATLNQNYTLSFIGAEHNSQATLNNRADFKSLNLVISPFVTPNATATPAVKGNTTFTFNFNQTGTFSMVFTVPSVNATGAPVNGKYNYTVTVASRYIESFIAMAVVFMMTYMF